MKVTVDQNICASSGNCVVLLNANPPAEQAEGARRAAALCPALAIHIEE